MARERELGVEHRAEQCRRGGGFPCDFRLQLRLNFDAQRLVVGGGPDLGSGLRFDGHSKPRMQVPISL